MYKIIKTVSFLIRYAICCITIDQVALFENEATQWLFSLFFGSVLYSILWAICYFLVGVISQKLSVNSSSVKSGLYFALYIVFVILIFGILRLLTRFGVLPIGEEITFQLEEWLTKKTDSIWQTFSDWIIHFTDNASNASF